MTKLEPTRTSSDLTATERLRSMLDERGVEWWQSANTLGCIFTRWYSPIFGDEVVAMENGKEGLVLFDHFMTPEQAIAATLGSCNCTNDCTNDCTNSERTKTCRVEETERFECLDSRYKSFDYNPYITVHVMECSECGHTYEHVNGGYEFCPRCGRRCVE